MTTVPFKTRHRVLEVLALNVPVTPQAINDHVNIGDYASKWVSLLNKGGWTIDAIKENKRVTHYVMTADHPNIVAIRAGWAALAAEKQKAKAPKVKAEKPAKPVKVAKVKAEKPAKVTAPVKSDAEIERIRAANLARMKEVGARLKRINKSTQTGVADFTPDQASADLAAFNAELDSFKMPAFLTKDEVKYLV